MESKSQNESDVEPDDQLNVSVDSNGSKRGRPPIQDQWTRVMKVPNYENQLGHVRIFTLATELLLEDSLPQVPRTTRSKNDWTLFFHPVQYWIDHPGLTLENCTLTNKKLQAYAK